MTTDRQIDQEEQEFISELPLDVAEWLALAYTSAIDADLLNAYEAYRDA